MKMERTMYGLIPSFLTVRLEHKLTPEQSRDVLYNAGFGGVKKNDKCVRHARVSPTSPFTLTCSRSVHYNPHRVPA